MKKKVGRKKRQGLGKYRIPTAGGTQWHKDKSKYNRKKKHKGFAHE
jgi:hypothetical protein